MWSTKRQNPKPRVLSENTDRARYTEVKAVPNRISPDAIPVFEYCENDML